MNRQQLEDSCSMSNMESFSYLLSRSKILPEEKVRILVPLAQDGNELAREQLVMHLIRMAYTTAKHYMKMWYTRLPASYTLEDACMAGIEGSLWAINDYKPDHANGAKLSTFAAMRITNKVQRSIYASIGFCRIPEWIILEREGKTIVESFARSLDSCGGESETGTLRELLEDDRQFHELEMVESINCFNSFMRDLDGTGMAGDMRGTIVALAALGYNDDEIRGFLPKTITRSAISGARRSMSADLKMCLNGDPTNSMF